MFRIIAIIEAGLTDFWMLTTRAKIESNTKLKDKSVFELNLDNFEVYFYLLIFGETISTIVFIFEYYKISLPCWLDKKIPVKRRPRQPFISWHLKNISKGIILMPNKNSLGPVVILQSRIKLRYKRRMRKVLKKITKIN